VTWWQWALVAVAGAAGAPLRYVVDTLVSERVSGVFPLGTLVVNVSGSLVLGVITGLAIYHGFTGAPRVVLGTGLVGAYTTYSTFTFETISLLEQGEGWSALRNILWSVVAAGAAAAAGIALAATV
jgi:CrcB protein